MYISWKERPFTIHYGHSNWTFQWQSHSIYPLSRRHHLIFFWNHHKYFLYISFISNVQKLYAQVWILVLWSTAYMSTRRWYYKWGRKVYKNLNRDHGFAGLSPGVVEFQALQRLYFVFIWALKVRFWGVWNQPPIDLLAFILFLPWNIITN